MIYQRGLNERPAEMPGASRCAVPVVFDGLRRHAVLLNVLVFDLETDLAAGDPATLQLKAETYLPDGGAAGRLAQLVADVLDDPVLILELADRTHIVSSACHGLPTSLANSSEFFGAGCNCGGRGSGEYTSSISTTLMT